MGWILNQRGALSDGTSVNDTGNTSVPASWWHCDEYAEQLGMSLLMDYGL